MRFADQGKLGGKLTAFAHGGLYLQAAAVFGQSVFGNRQAQACATAGTRAACVYAVEALGEAGDVFGGDTRAIVGHAETGVCHVGIAVQAYADVATVMVVAHSIENQIAQGIVQIQLHPLYPQIRLDVGIECLLTS